MKALLLILWVYCTVQYFTCILMWRAPKNLQIVSLHCNCRYFYCSVAA